MSASRATASVERYKRNQVESVLWALLSGPFRTAVARLGSEPPAYFRARLKRLLATDVGQARKLGVRLPEFGTAFFDDLPEGRGTDVGYTPSKILNLAIGLELVRFGCKPGEVVEVIADQRKALQNVFDRVNRKVVTKGHTRHDNLNGGKKQRESIFLVLQQVEAPRAMELPSLGRVSEGETFLGAEIVGSRQDLHRRMNQLVPQETPQLLVMELAEMSARITELLGRSLPRSRGKRASCG